MTEQRFLISDAAKMVAVEAHVLRYWEEELEIPIARTELGHRYYTRENIEVFQKVKELKEKGLQLRAIRMMLVEERCQEAERAAGGGCDGQTEHAEKYDGDGRAKKDAADGTLSPAVLAHNTQKLRQFEALVSEIVDKVVKENNEELQSRMEASFSREMEYFLHIQEKREEERFRKLDEAIRAHQKQGKMAAATKEKGLFRKWFSTKKDCR